MDVTAASENHYAHSTAKETEPDKAGLTHFTGTLGHTRLPVDTAPSWQSSRGVWTLSKMMGLLGMFCAGLRVGPNDPLWSLPTQLIL